MDKTLLELDRYYTDILSSSDSLVEELTKEQITSIIDKLIYNATMYIHNKNKNSNYNNSKITSLITTNKKYLNYKSFDKDTLLHHCVFHNSYELVSLLLNYCKLNIRDDEGQVAIHRVAFIKNIEIVKLLLDNGADINSVDNSLNTPLHLSVLIRNYEMIDILLSLGANPELKNKLGIKPIQYSMMDYSIDERVQEIFNKY